MQMALSFGHMHRDDLGLRPLIDASRSQAAINLVDHADELDPQPHTVPDHHCLICASMALLGNGAPVMAPALAVSLHFERRSMLVKMTADLRPQIILSFQARGPPII
jgi:hypothetical protein